MCEQALSPKDNPECATGDTFKQALSFLFVSVGTLVHGFSFIMLLSQS